MIIAWQLRRDQETVAHRHEAERQVRRLASKPREPSRSRRIKRIASNVPATNSPLQRTGLRPAAERHDVRRTRRR